MTQWRHYSDQTITTLFDASQVDAPALKPRGLWISDEDGDDGWKTWCENEAFELGRLVVEHEVILAPEANVLELHAAEDLDAFTAQYGVGSGGFWDSRIAWAEVAEAYQGILITPYIWSRRLTGHTFWYSGWDCASGCIWDADAIGRVAVLASESAS